MTDFSTLPRYQCHKVVRAMKFNEMEFRDGGALLRPENEKLVPIQVDQAYLDKHAPKAPGYFVVYDDGYQSWSPVKAFEDGYARLDDSKAARAAIVEQLVHELQARLTGGAEPNPWHEAVVALKNAYERAEQLTDPRYVSQDRHRAADEVAKLP